MSLKISWSLIHLEMLTLCMPDHNWPDSVHLSSPVQCSVHPLYSRDRMCCCILTASSQTLHDLLLSWLKHAHADASTWYINHSTILYHILWILTLTLTFRYVILTFIEWLYIVTPRCYIRSGQARKNQGPCIRTLRFR